MPRPVGESDRGRRFFHQLAQVAGRQHAVVSLQRILALDVPERTVQRWAQEGRIHRIYRGVYSLVPAEALSVNGRRLAAVLSCGPGAGLSRRSAGDQRGLRRTARARIDVIVPRSNHSQGHAGIDVHRSQTLIPADITLVDGIPTTTVSRTLLDLAGLVRPDELERALNQAEVLRVFDRRAIDDQLARNPHHPGVRALRTALDLYRVEAAPTESVAEDAFLTLVRQAGLAEPDRQLHVGLGPGEPVIRADFAWPAERVIVEVDGRGFHATRAAFESDRHRDALLQAAGWRVLRFTARQIRDDPGGVIRILLRALGAGARAA